MSPVKQASQTSLLLSERVAASKRVKRELENLPEKQFDICLSGPHSNFKETYGFKLIGVGSFGQVYLANFAGENIVVKEAYLTAKEKTLMLKGVGRNSQLGTVSKKSYPAEYFLATLINKILTLHKGQNFLFTLDLGVCDTCQMGKSKPNKFCYVTFMEAAEFGLEKLARTGLTQADVLNFTLQMLIALFTIEFLYGIVHRDIKLENILVKRITPGGYFQYVIGSNTYLVENRGFLLFLADFGVSSSLMPKYVNKLDPLLTKNNMFYGTRNAKIIDDSYWKPITCEYSVITLKDTPKLNHQLLRMWKDGSTLVRGSYNNFYEGFDLEPDIAIDFNDTLTFPPFEFFGDIQDVLRTMVGGRRATQRDMHPGLGVLAPKIITDNLLDRFEYKIYGTAKYMRADLMLMEIYSAIPVPITANILDTFIIR